jgi:hypothetical protein
MTESNIGLTLWGVAGAPATNNAAGFEALTWVQLKGMDNLPVFGVTHANNDVRDIATGFTSGNKGAATGKDTSFTYNGDGTDTGVATAITAAETRPGTYSLKTVRGSGTDAGDGPAPASGDPVQYAQGYLHTYEENPKDDSTNEGASINFKQNAPTVVATQPV